MTNDASSAILASFGVGIALASAPGPVQAVLLTEAVRGGVARGLRALAGSSLTFGCLMVALAVGLSVAPPSGPAVRILKVAGGVLLLWLAVDGIRSGYNVGEGSQQRRSLPPAARGSLAIILNPGAWLFLAAVASPLLASATRAGGRGVAVVAAMALVIGAGIGDLGVVLLAGLGLRRAGQPVVLWFQRILATLLAALGVWLVVQGLTS